MDDRRALQALARDLETMHGWREWHWWPDADPFEVIVGAILVQNTAWANVERALALLRDAGVLTDPTAMAALTPDQLEELVRPSGQYRQKAKKLRAFLALIEEHGSLDELLALPSGELRPTLLATWGIGKETADCIILYAARRSWFIVDAYLIRLFSRLGLGPVGSTSYDDWMAWITANLHTNNRDDLARLRAEIVLHCKFLCRKNAPRCDECVLLPRCPGSPINESRPSVALGGVRGSPP
ncbi:MAG: endonuclease III domain-containing protein [Anaerolineales bacterium]